MKFGDVDATVVHQIETGTDSRRNPILGDGTSYVLEGCRVDIATTDEDLADRDTVVTRWILIGPKVPTGETLTARDVIRIDAAVLGVPEDPTHAPAATFRIAGHPDQTRHLAGVHHTELTLELVDL